MAGSVETEKEVYECPVCKDKEGFIVRVEDGSEAWRWCECHEKKRIARLFQYSEITEKFRKMNFTNFSLMGRPQPVSDAFHCASAYLEEFQLFRGTRTNSIALLGNPGSGKTHLLTAISNGLLLRGIPLLYFPWVEGFNDLKANFDLLNTKLERLKKVEVLFLDDLFKGRKLPTEFQLETLFEVINYRYLNHLPILVSSEKEIDDICQFDEGLGSRIYEMCKDFTVLIRGDRKKLNYRLLEVS